MKFTQGRSSVRWVAALAALAIAAVVAWGALHKPPAPEVALTSLDGDTLRMAELRGQVVLVNFWATTCAVCVTEMPSIVATHRKLAQRGFETFAVAMQFDQPERVLNYQQRHQLPFKIVLDKDGELARAFDDTRLTPTSFLIDKRGRIVWRYQGAPDFAALERRIERLLAG